MSRLGSAQIAVLRAMRAGGRPGFLMGWGGSIRWHWFGMEQARPDTLWRLEERGLVSHTRDHNGVDFHLTDAGRQALRYLEVKPDA